VNLILALRKLLEQPKVNTLAALRLTMKITETDPRLFDKLGIYDGKQWVL
jgi:hypothetical protein